MPSFSSKRAKTPRSTLFPYTTLFRSDAAEDQGRAIHPGAAQRVPPGAEAVHPARSEEHTSELQSLRHLACRLFLQSGPRHRDLHSFPTRRSSDLTPLKIKGELSTQALRNEFRRAPKLSILLDRKSTRLNSSHLGISHAVFFFKAGQDTEIYTLSLHDALPI